MKHAAAVIALVLSVWEAVGLETGVWPTITGAVGLHPVPGLVGWGAVVAVVTVHFAQEVIKRRRAR